MTSTHTSRNIRAMKAFPKCNPLGCPRHMSCPSHTAGRNVHEPASMTEHGFSSYLGPLPAIHICGFLSEWLLWLEGVGQSCPPSCLPQRSDNLPWEWAPSLNVFIVTLPYSLVSITKPFQLDLQPEATLRNAAKAQTFFWNFLWVELMVASLVSGCVRQSPVADSGPESAVLSWESLLESDSLPVIPADLYCRLSITIYGAPQGLCSQPVMGGWLQPWLDWRGDCWTQAPIVWGCWWLPAGWAEYCTHCWCFFPWCQHGSSYCFDLQVCCQGSSPISCAWDKGQVKTDASLECQ